MTNIIVLTGAEVSAESGRSTFRHPDGQKAHSSPRPKHTSHG